VKRFLNLARSDTGYARGAADMEHILNYAGVCTNR
jgi:hypothetical protein